MLILAYFSPEVILPVASIFAAGFGFLMMLGRAPFRLAAKGFRALTRKTAPAESRPGDPPSEGADPS